MQKVSAIKSYTRTKVTEGIFSTLAFFDLYNLPLSAERVWELLYKVEASQLEVRNELERLYRLDFIVKKNGLYALREWDTKQYMANLVEKEKRWTKIKKYFWLLSAIPFIEHVSVINSVAMGNADHESDIDFFVVTKPNRLYFVRSLIIILFKIMGAYKTKDKINEQFCFGFYITSDRLSIKHLLLSGSDPYLTFWLGTVMPIIGVYPFEKFIRANKWIHSLLPNYRTHYRYEKIRELKGSKKTKNFLETVLNPIGFLLEPIVRRIHIKHTFKLPENRWTTSSTIADKFMLKLHAIDPRKDLRKRWEDILQNYK